MDNPEITVQNFKTLKADKKMVYLDTGEIIKVVDQDVLRSGQQKIGYVGEPEVKLPSSGNVEESGAEIVIGNHNDSNEIMRTAKNMFVEQFKDASVERKQVVMTKFYEALNSVYKVTYRGEPVPIIFTKKGGYAYNHDGFIRIPLNILEKQTTENAVYSILHEYRHAMQPSLGMCSLGLPSLTVLDHNLRFVEIDATKFAFENMDNLGLDKTKIDDYDDCQKAIQITDTVNLLRQNYGEETADNVSDIYRLLDMYVFQTTRPDVIKSGIKGKLFKISAWIKFKQNITTAKNHLKILEKVATLNNDSFLLKTVSGIRADWPQFHM